MMKLPLSLYGAVAAIAVAAQPVRADVDFAKEIKPLIEQHCIKCHSGMKPKGGFSMETKALFDEGGAEGKPIVVGKSAESRLYKMVVAPKGDDTRMPPEGEPLAKAVTDKFKAWIDEGAKWPANVSIKAPPKEVVKAPVEETGLPITPAEKAAVEKLEKAGVFVMRLAQNTNWLRVDFTHRGKDVKDDELALLKDCPNLVELNLGGLNISDSQAVHLKPLTNMIRLQLHRTKITDNALANLTGMTKLVSLNLYDTAVTDNGIQQLKGNKSLKRLYVWQTKVTENGAKQLAAAINGIDINRGYELPPPDPKKEEDPKKEDPKKKEPKKKTDPKKVDPKKEEPKKEEPKKEEPKKEEPKKEELKTPPKEKK